MSSIRLPKGRSLATEYANTLTAQANIMPELLAAQSEYQPLQSANQLANLNYALMGTPEFSYETQEYVPAVYVTGRGKRAQYSYGKVPRGVQGTISYPELPATKRIGGGKRGGGGFSMPGPTDLIGGVGDMFRPGGGGGGFKLPGMGGGGGGFKLPGMGGGGGFDFGLGGMFGSDDDEKKPVKRLVSAGYYRTKTNTSPAHRGMLDIYTKDVLPTLSGGIIPKLTDQANYELELGSNMSPAMLRQAMQAVRSRQAGILGGTGSSGDFQEALGLSTFGQSLLRDRQRFAGDVAAMRMGANPVSQALGLSTLPGATSLLNPESGYAGDIYNSNWNAQVSKAISNAQMKNDLWGAGISAFGNLAGGAAAMAV